MASGSTLEAIRSAPSGEANKRRFNQSGQAMGAKGLLTRRTLMAATIALLEQHALRNLKVVDIAEAAGLSAPTFYLYFDSVSDAVLAAIGELSQSTPTILALLDEEWHPGNGHDLALAVVLEHVGYWDRHRALLRVRNLAAEEGDKRFFKMRRLSLEALLRALTAQVDRQKAAGRVSARYESLPMAGALLAALDRIGAVIHLYRNRTSTNDHQLIRATAYIIANTLGCA